jgi:ATP-dependent 26S proteasome regulatory subunit
MPPLSHSLDLLLEVLARSGETYEGSAPAARLERADLLLATCERNAGEGAAQVLRSERELARLRSTCDRLMGTIDELQESLEQLLGVKPVLCRLEGLHGDEDPLSAAPRAIVALGSQLREVAIHESVSLEQLRALEPWHYVLVHPEELVLLAVYDHPELFERSRGELVEFQGFLERSGEWVRIARAGHQDSVARLAPRLRGRELAPGSRLVLLRGDERWAIDLVPEEGRRSRFETPIEELQASFDSLAGLEPVIEPLVLDALLRTTRPDLAERHDVRPYRGVLLSSTRPGTGKTATVKAYARFVYELGRQQGFEVVLYHVLPGELKSVWHGGDALRVREELCGAIRARARAPRTRALYQIVFLDEIDSLGKREGHDLASGAQNDAALALLAELDGLRGWDCGPGNPPAHLIWFGATNRPDRIDGALLRNRRFADFKVTMPELTVEGAEAVLAVHAGRLGVPWYLDGEVVSELAPEELRARFLRPALARVFDAAVLRYSAEPGGTRTVTAGALLAGAHYEEVMNGARRASAVREMLASGVPAVTLEDVLEHLILQACKAAQRMDEDRSALARELAIAGRITRVELVHPDELRSQRFALVS